MKKYKRIILILILLFFFFGVFTAFSLFNAYKSAKHVSAALNSQDLDAAKNSIKKARNELKMANTALIVFTPLRFVPLVGWYIADVQRGTYAAVATLDAAQVMAEAITPYADILGLRGQGTFLGGTAQERVASIIETLSKVSPQLNEIGDNLKEAKDQISKIQAWKYPNFLPGRPKDKIESAQTAIIQFETLIVDAKPFIEVLPEIMGQGSEKTYLVLLQNDKELRPTGGFITAYAILKVNKGDVKIELSEDIYKLDDTLTKRVAAPDHIKKYLEVQSLNLRDSNISPDYLSSIKLFEDLYQYSTAKKQYEGIIALNTNFVLKMIKALGPIEIDGTKYTAEVIDECACPQIIYQLEQYTGQPTPFQREDRKGIIGVLMQQLLAKTFEAPQSTWPDILGAVVSSLQEKDLLLYFENISTQEAVEKVNFAGRIYQYDSDFLHINESNLGGAKSNIYIKEKVKQEIKRDKDITIKKVTIEYKYPRKMDNCSLERKGGLCLAGIYRDWIRLYVPKGSKIIAANGSEAPLETYDELGKTVFEGFLTVRPEGTAKFEIEYSLPIEFSKEYKLLVQKQPGAPAHEYEINAFGKRISFPLNTDKEFIAKI